jgi:hypothetical protein
MHGRRDEQMMRESDEGKTAREMMPESGFRSPSAWYWLKSKYKQEHRQSAHPDNMPDCDSADDEEGEEESVVHKPPAAAPVGPKRYD